MDKLKPSRDSKVTNSVTPTGNARGFNSFGLPSGREFSCPFATDYCGSICYAGKLETIRPAVRNVMLHNWELVKNADYDTLVSLLSDMISDFVSQTDKANAKGKDSSYDFRIHWDGDFFSAEYAKAWAAVCRAFPHVRFWVYTRSFSYVRHIVGIDNLTVYLSGDRDNIAQANATARRYGLPVAMVGETFGEARESLSGRSYDCPENGKRMPLISAKGSACLTCGVCPDSRGNVAFSRSGK